MKATMHKLERNTKMDAAIARCKQAHPKVRRIDARTVRVLGRKATAYTVVFTEPKAGLKLAACDCQAGLAGMLCYHIAAACAAPVVV